VLEGACKLYAKAYAAKLDKGMAMFSARDSAPEKQLPLKQIDLLVKSALRRMQNAPTVRVVASPESIGLRAPVNTVPSGVTLANGDIYVFQSGIGSALDVDMVVFHEVFHKGLQNVLPRADYVATMQEIAKIDSNAIWTPLFKESLRLSESSRSSEKMADSVKHPKSVSVRASPVDVSDIGQASGSHSIGVRSQYCSFRLCL
jgi:hypothetical protein